MLTIADPNIHNKNKILYTKHRVTFVGGLCCKRYNQTLRKFANCIFVWLLNKFQLCKNWHKKDESFEMTVRRRIYITPFIEDYGNDAYNSASNNDNEAGNKFLISRDKSGVVKQQSCNT